MKHLSSRPGLGTFASGSVIACVAWLAACSSDSAKSGGPLSGHQDGGGEPSTDAGTGTDGSSPGNPKTDAMPSADSGGGDASGGSIPVTTKSGVVLGKLEGKTRAFYGIPYAAPPTGQNRWKPPQPVTAWTSPRDATQPPKVCPQIGVGSKALDARSDEDCLVVNVWTPDPVPAKPLPVMVWIHGGAFLFGSGGETYYSGQHLVEEGNVVVVSMNYRLGALGFLSLPALTAESTDHPTSGNYGFEDQQAALKWVKDNASAFGGDPAQVTIFGESAGGYSVCAHLVAPGSAGLFQRAISESGLCDGLIDSTRDIQYDNGAAFAAAAGCTDSTKLLDCLRGKTAGDLVGTTFGAAAQPGGLFFQGPRTPGDAGPTSTTWSPVVDGVVLPVGPGRAGASFNKVPLLLGTNANEGTLFTNPTIFGGQPVTSDTEYQDAVTRTFTSQAANVLAQYPSASFPSPNDALNTLATDGFFVCPARRLARDATAAGSSVYLYDFAHVPEQPLVPGLGAFHSAELAYVFGATYPLDPAQADEAPLGTQMRAYWTRFAHASDPNGGADPSWTKYVTADDKNMKLDLPASAMEAAYLKSKCDFWDTIVAP